MKVYTISESTSIDWDTFHFSPNKVWPKNFPNFAWKSFCIAGFNPDCPVTVDLEGTFATAVHSCYENLGLIELAHLYQKVQSHITKEDWQELCSLYNINCDATTLILLDKITTLPRIFQNWASEKKLGISDFAVLQSLNLEIYSNDAFLLMEKITNNKLSRQLGVQALEIGIELILTTGNSDFLISLEHFSGQYWLKELHKKRYPMTTNSDQLMQEKTQSLSWPRHSKATWVRNGDHSGIQLQTTFSSQKELEKYLSSLNHLSTTLSSAPEKLWQN